MKIAIPAADKVKTAEHFGRAGLFAVYDTEKSGYEYIDNEANLNAAQGAGIQSATALINNGVGAVLSPRIGPKAFDVLKAAEIKMYILPADAITIEGALDLYNKGRLEMFESSKK
jgi:predicted Fe-Mo cluster-binding NifX family protein